MQTVAPDASLYLEAGHSAQTVIFCADENVPGSHGTHEVKDELLLNPAVQAIQTVAPDRLYVPPAQGTQASSVLFMYVPGSQSTHCVNFELDTDPDGQAVQLHRPELEAIFPTSHFVQLYEPFSEYLPAEQA